MNKELAIKLLRGSVLGTNEQLHEAVFMAIRALKAEPTKHGRWSEKHYCSNLTGYDYAVICSECEKPTYRQFAEPTPDYCPNCGADMRGE